MVLSSIFLLSTPVRTPPKLSVKGGVVTTPPWVVTTTLVVTTPFTTPCNLSVSPSQSGAEVVEGWAPLHVRWPYRSRVQQEWALQAATAAAHSETSPESSDASKDGENREDGRRETNRGGQFGVKRLGLLVYFACPSRPAT